MSVRSEAPHDLGKNLSLISREKKKKKHALCTNVEKGDILSRNYEKRGKIGESHMTTGVDGRRLHENITIITYLSSKEPKVSTTRKGRPLFEHGKKRVPQLGRSV